MIRVDLPGYCSGGGVSVRLRVASFAMVKILIERD